MGCLGAVRGRHLPHQRPTYRAIWLLFGTLPSSEFSFGAVPQPGLAVTFDVRDHAIAAADSFQFACDTGAVSTSGDGPQLTGTVTQDGHFTVTPGTPGNFPGVSITVQGAVPRQDGGAWTGTYTASTSGKPVCRLSRTATFTATPISAVQGTYTGTGSAEVLDEITSTSSKQMLSLSMTLQQGATLYRPRLAPLANSALALSGTISLHGIPCFIKGTTSTESESTIAGNRIGPVFDMDDGSQVLVSGYLKDVDAMGLQGLSLRVRGGKCDAVYFLSSSNFVVQRR